MELSSNKEQLYIHSVDNKIVLSENFDNDTLKKIKVIFVDNCCRFIGSEFNEDVPNLEELSVFNCFNFTTTVMNIKKLVELQVDSCMKFTGTGLEKHKNLACLVVNSCPLFYDIYSNMFESLSLTSLYVENCDDFVGSFGFLKNLEILSVYNCDSFVAKDIKNAKRLRSIDIYNCSGFTGKDIIYLPLVEFHITKCPNFSFLSFQ